MAIEYPVGVFNRGFADNVAGAAYDRCLHRSKIEEGLMVTTTLRAPDISCEHCVATVKKTVGQFAGVQSVNADADTKQITIAYDPSQVDLGKVEAALADEGYPVQK